MIWYPTTFSITRISMWNLLMAEQTGMLGSTLLSIEIRVTASVLGALAGFTSGTLGCECRGSQYIVVSWFTADFFSSRSHSVDIPPNDFGAFVIWADSISPVLLTRMNLAPVPTSLSMVSRVPQWSVAISTVFWEECMLMIHRNFQGVGLSLGASFVQPEFYLPSLIAFKHCIHFIIKFAHPRTICQLRDRRITPFLTSGWLQQVSNVYTEPIRINYLHTWQT